MKRKILSVLIVFIFIGCVGGFEKGFDEFDPMALRSPDEQAIGKREVFLQKEWDKARISGDTSGILSCYTRDAEIMTGGGKPVMVSKEGYGERLLERLEAEGTKYRVLFRGAPKIKLLGPNEAEVKQITQIRTKMRHDVVNKRIYIKTENGRWLIRKSTYTF